MTGAQDGNYTLHVRSVIAPATADSQEVTGSAGSATYQLDTTADAPGVTPMQDPAGSANAPSWSFAGESGASFDCRLDRGTTTISDWATCGSAPQSYDLSGEPDGTYTFSVRQTDAAGNQSAASTSDYTLDTTTPDAPVIMPMQDPAGSANAPSWSFAGESGASFDCRLDRGTTTISDWATCGSAPQSYDLSGEPDGTYTFSVRQTDAAGNPSAASTSDYTLDTTTPAAPTVTSGPNGRTNDPRPSLAFSSSEGTTECRLLRAGATVYDWTRCTSPWGYGLTTQPDGDYEFQVRARDQAGNVGATASRSFTLDRAVPETPAAAAPSGPLYRAGVCINLIPGSTSKADTITGSIFGDVLEGLGGNDRLNGMGGDDCLLGDAGNDRLDGGAGNDDVRGLAGNDVLRGGTGNDKLSGGPGRDTLYGDAGNDTLVGGKGADRLIGGPGKDRFYGEAGNDFIDSRDGRAERVDCGPGRDTARADRNDHLIHCEKRRR